MLGELWRNEEAIGDDENEDRTMLELDSH
jgi:hypothetical protein